MQHGGDRLGFWLVVAALAMMIYGLGSSRWLVKTSDDWGEYYGPFEMETCNYFRDCEEIDLDDFESENREALVTLKKFSVPMLIIGGTAALMLVLITFTSWKRDRGGIAIATFANAAALAAAIYWIHRAPGGTAVGNAFPIYLVGALCGLIACASRALPPPAPAAAPPPPPPPPPEDPPAPTS